MLRLTGSADETGRWCAPPRGQGSHLRPPCGSPSLSLRLRVSYDPTTRVHVRLLGPCFKTGRVVSLEAATDPQSPGPASASREERSSGTVAQSLTVEHPTKGRRPARETADPRSSEARHRREAITARPRGSGLPSSRLYGRPRTGRDVPPRGKCTRRAPRHTEGRALGSGPTCAPNARSRLNSAGMTSRYHPFTSARFHVLLNYLFKVLFNFPSRYLSAIGLVPVFSLRWSLPPTLGCILKQPDS